jgi:transcriptional regulator with XRE-family HTH domain
MVSSVAQTAYPVGGTAGRQDQFAEFVRTRRERLRPGDVGLPAGRRRRTPGLRREEVAALAAVSVDYYTRLEQDRGPHPSRQVLSGLAKALRLSDDERTHLYRLADGLPDGPDRPPRDISPEMLTIPDRDQRLILYTAEPGTSSYEALQLLKPFGTLDLTTILPRTEAEAHL